MFWLLKCPTCKRLGIFYYRGKAMAEGTSVEGVVGKAGGWFEKFNHPVLGPFITAWIVCNWEIFYALLGGFNAPFVTIAQVKTDYVHWSNLELSVLPIMVTVGYLGFGPIAARLYNHYLLVDEIEGRFNAEREKGNEPITKNEYNKREHEYFKQLQENEVLRAEIFLLQGQLGPQMKDIIFTVNNFGISGSLHDALTQFQSLKKEKEELQKKYEALRYEQLQKNDLVTVKKTLEEKNSNNLGA